MPSANFVEDPPSFEVRRGLVYVTLVSGDEKQCFLFRPSVVRRAALSALAIVDEAESRANVIKLRG